MRINRVAAATILSVLASGVMIATNSTPAGAYSLGTVKVSPSKNLADNQQITVHISGFGSDTGPDATPPGTTTWYVVECTSQIVSSGGDTSYCDQSDPTSPTQDPNVPNHVVKVTNESNGSGTAQFKVHTGADWLGTHPGAKCDYKHACYVVVTDGQTEPTTTWAGLAPVTFKDPRAVTKTKVKASKKSAKAKSKVSITATTTHIAGTAKLTGKVVFKDNGKKFKSLKEKATGKLTAKVKLVKGKNKITVSYPGDTNYKPSAGKVTVKGK